MTVTEHTEVHGIGSAIRGMRNPLNSWHKSDTVDSSDILIKEVNGGISQLKGIDNIGPNDLELAKVLVRNGSEHRKFLRFITVTVDMTLPLFVWKQMDTYKFLDTNSCSTMHKLSSKPLTIDDFTHDACDEKWMSEYIDMMNSRIDYIKRCKKIKAPYAEHERFLFEMLLNSYNQKRTVSTDYETLLSMYFQRKGHKLEEWNEIRTWIERLPYMKTFITAIEEKQ